jgi:hypothetical protein
MGIAARAQVLTLLPRLLPDAFPGFTADPIPDAPVLNAAQQDAMATALRSEHFGAFTDALAKVGGCSNPVKLVGSSLRANAHTGEVTSTFSSKDQALGVVHVPCGNRRASKCPSCARTFGSDTYWLIKTGMTGGKTIPARVADNPLVFATFTAPSFGAVHGRRDAGACHPRRGTCEHGRPLGCFRRHAGDDTNLGQPLCAGCYDYTSHLIWQWHAGDVWQRFNMAIKRAVARYLGVPGSKVTENACVQYAKVAELQARGAIHFHALVRLDGPKSSRGYEPAPAAIDATVLGQLIKEAAAKVRLEVPGTHPDDVRRAFGFGGQIDVRTVHPGRRVDDPTGPLTAEHVARYVAKYSTKSVSDDARNNPHFSRLRATAHVLAQQTRDAAEDWRALGLEPPRYVELSRVAHELGFHGQFATKSRRYGLTRGQLHRARQRVRILEEQARRSGEVLDLAAREAELYAKEAADDEAEVVISEWRFAGTGWANESQTTLALASAAAAREYARDEAEERRNQSTNHSRGEHHHEED